MNKPENGWARDSTDEAMPRVGALVAALAGSRWRGLWTALALASVCWLVIAFIAGPAVVGVWPGGGLSAAIGALRDSVRDGVLILLVIGLLVPSVAAFDPSRVASWVEPATAKSLGAIRIWVALVLFASVLWEDLASSAHLPRGMLNLDSHWLIRLLHGLPIGFDAMMASGTALTLFEALTAVLLVAAAGGLFTRWTVPAAAVAYLLFAAILRSYAWSYHMGLVPLYCLLLLAFTRCGDALSIDRALRQRRGDPVPPADEPALVYGLGRYLVWMAVAVPYLMAGLSKLRNTGVLWWRGEHLKQMVIATVVESMQFDFDLAFLMLRGPAVLFDALGLVALLTELVFVLVLVSRIARAVLPALMAATHVGILVMQNILFPDLIAIQAVFYDWAPVGRRIQRLAGAIERGDGRVARRASLIPVSVVREARVGAAFLVVAAVAWATRTERFPITAMQMFSRPVPLAPVEYVRPLVVYEDGTSERARFERWIGAMADARYRRLLAEWDDPQEVALLRAFLDAAATRANETLPPGRRVSRFVLEVRRWDFREAPADPARGSLVARVTHDVAFPEQITSR